MKKKLMALICVILSLVIVSSQSLVALASSSVTPVVMVHGMGSFGLYKNPNTEEEEELAGFDISSLLGDNGLLRKLLRVAQGENVKKSEIINALKDFMVPFEDIGCDSNGNPKGNIGINSYWEDSLANHQDWLESKDNNEPAIYRQVCDKIGAENVYAFNYDWRLDACDNAKKLNTFINKVKAQTGKSQVTLVGGSEGTVVVSAYIDQYKSKNDIKKVVFIDGAWQGVSVTNAFKQDLYIDDEVLMEYVKQFCKTYNGKVISTAPLTLIVGLFSDAFTNLSKYLNEVIDDKDMLNKVYTDVLGTFGSIPILWEFIPYNSFNSAVSKMSKIGFLDKSSGMYKKISKYHKIQGRAKSNLKALKDKGVEIAITANYGTPGIPVTSAYDEQTDILIDAKYATGGATFAKYGKTLDKTGKYVSDDKIVDASTAAFPDNTWIIKSVQHMNYWYGTEANKFIAYLITTNDKLNIKNVKKKTGYDQFLGTDREQNIISVTDCGTDQYALGEEVGAVGKVKDDDETTTAKTTLGAESETKSPPTSAPSELAGLGIIALGAGLLVAAYRKKQNA